MSFSLSPRHLTIRWITPKIWNIFPQRRADALQEFSLIERDSAYQLLRCLRMVDDPSLKAYIFQHVLEEVFHGDLFESAASQFSNRPVSVQGIERENVSGDVADFFSYVHVGEQAVNRDFMQYAKAELDPQLRAVFRRAGGDEGKHENDTGDILLEMVRSDHGRLSRLILRARGRRAWAVFKRLSNKLGAIFLNVWLAAIYFALGLWAVAAARRRLQWDSERQLRVIKSQVSDFEREFV